MTARKMPFHRFLSAVTLCMAIAHLSAAQTPGEVPVGAQLRDATLQGLNVLPRKLTSFRGRPLLINVWASWCGPCKQEMATLERLAWTEQYFSIIGISTDDDADKAKSFLSRTHASISHFIDHDLQMENMLGASVLPLTVLVSADGRVLKKIYGSKQWDGPDAIRLIDETFRHKPSSRHTPGGVIASASPPPPALAGEPR
jgi:thiol-disulfide isomerase/thioredoxin